MKKVSSKIKPYPQQQEEKLNIVEEPTLMMRPLHKFPATVADFSYKKFQKVADKTPFTLAEWAAILHLSERTLQRYAKDNKSFEGIYVDRILQIENLIDMGLQTFKSSDAFYNWLKAPKEIGGYQYDLRALSRTQGIQELYDQLGRIQHGIF